MHVLLVTGLPCAGKTSISRFLADALSLSLASKDGFKELLFDTLGWSTREWSKKLDIPAIALLFQFLQTEVAAGHMCLIEHWFSAPGDVQRFTESQMQHNFAVVQILCVARGQVLAERFKTRAMSGQRHPGHCDHQTLDEHYPILMRGRVPALPTNGPIIEVDTSDFQAVDFKRLLADVSAALNTSDNPL